MFDQVLDLTGAALLWFGVFFVALIVAAIFVDTIGGTAEGQMRHVGVMNFAMLFTIFVLLAINL